jgi:hypothetical protein
MLPFMFRIGIYRYLLILSFHFSCAIDAIPEGSLKKKKALVAGKIKQRLSLLRMAAFYQRHVIDMYYNTNTL